ncbi:hypothetical protein N8230_01140 [Gammaproteobacteria bacterium]|jgi:hypothetical protein|nr:hypothetical protein [Gammaproteobacteria bacterium]|tara:strand:+ start:84 stop:803 length:720 start_codon:yes stop_codon:yes gene_type:complete
MSKIKWKEFKHERMSMNGPYVSITDQGLTVGASAIEEFGMEAMNAVILMFSEDNLKLGLRFLEKPVMNSYKLICPAAARCNKSNTRQINCKAAITGNKLLSKLRDSKDREGRSFPAKKDKDSSDILYIELAPSFEYSIEFSDLKSIDNDLSGIYRCLDGHESVVYIGSGKIKTEAINAQKKCSTSFKYIEYSIITDRGEAFSWERYHQEDHIKKHGSLPFYNKVLAPKGTIHSLEALDA